MRVHYAATVLTADGPQIEPELYLEPQNEQERQMLEVVFRDCETRGHGRTGDPLRIRHVRIALTPKLAESGKEGE